MPERTIRKIYRGYTTSGFGSLPYYIEIEQETWLILALTSNKNEYVNCLVSQILDGKGNTLCIVNENFDFKTESYYTGSYWNFILHLPNEFVHDYGPKEGMFIDLLLIDVVRGSDKYPIFPKRLSIGKLEVQPKSNLDFPIPSAKLLVTTQFLDNFYNELVVEINRAYGYGLYTATSVLLRKLFENLIIDLLRIRYRMEKLELYYNKENGMHHNLSTLISNLRKNASDFKPFTHAFDDSFFNFLNELRERASGSAHSLDMATNPELLNKWQDQINQYSRLFLSVIQKVKDVVGS